MTCCARAEGAPPRAAIAAVLVVLGLLAAPLTGGRKSRSAAELTNPFLGPEYSQWLVGPIARMAAEKEIDKFLSLVDDGAARVFLDEFWERRDPDPGEPGNGVRETFEKRATEADKKFREAAYAGRRTDRGTIYILYGPPNEIEYEELRDVRGPDVELWRYPKGSTAGLDGRRPDRVYRFAKQGDLTSFFTPRSTPDPRSSVRRD